MNKVMTTVATMMMIGMVFLNTGCTTTTGGGASSSDLMKAQELGTVAGIAWIASSNPTANQKQEVVNTMLYVNSIASGVSVTNGTNFTAIVYPLVAQYIDKSNIPAQDKPLAKIGSLMALQAFDVYVSQNPKIFTDASVGSQLLVAFDNGAINALSLAETDPKIIEARKKYAEKHAK